MEATFDFDTDRFNPILNQRITERSNTSTKYRNVIKPIVSSLETIYVVIDRSVSHNVIGSVEFTTMDDPVSARPEHITAPNVELVGS